MRPPLKTKPSRTGGALPADGDRGRRATARVMREKRRARATRKIERASR